MLAVLNSVLSVFLTSAAVGHRAMASFLELDPDLRGSCAYGRKHGPGCILKASEDIDDSLRQFRNPACSENLLFPRATFSILQRVC